MLDKDFDWDEYYNTPPDYQKSVDILGDPRDKYKYIPKPLPLVIKEKLQQIITEIKQKIKKSH